MCRSCLPSYLWRANNKKQRACDEWSVWSRAIKTSAIKTNAWQRNTSVYRLGGQMDGMIKKRADGESTGMYHRRKETVRWNETLMKRKGTGMSTLLLFSRFFDVLVKYVIESKIMLRLPYFLRKRGLRGSFLVHFTWTNKPNRQMDGLSSGCMEAEVTSKTDEELMEGSMSQRQKGLSILKIV